MDAPRQRIVLVALGLLLAVSSAVQAGTVTVVFDQGQIATTTVPLTGFATTGAQMQGMTVTVSFESGGPETITWVATGAEAGGAFGTGWSLSEIGDAILGPWTLQNDSGVGITVVSVDGFPGATLLDTTFGGDFGTPGSGAGHTFEPLSGAFDMVDLMVTYRVMVGIEGAAPVGDLFQLLELEFTNLGGLASGSFISFVADADNVEAGGDLIAGGGACCLPEGCILATAAACLTVGGDYRGDGTSCVGDLDGDGMVGIVDFLALLGDWGSCPVLPSDIDEDGEVGISDFLILLAAWGPCDVDCPEDLNGDGLVGIDDFLILLGDWGAEALPCADLDCDDMVGITDFLILLANWG